MPELFDELRAAHPELGFSLYAQTPGGVVTFEIIAPDGETYQFKGRTAAEAMAAAFPPQNAASPEPEHAGSIFD